MSNQPSTMDNIRSTASSATHAVAETLDPLSDGCNKQNSNTNDGQETSTQKQTYQDKLKAAAYSNRPPPKKEETLIEKGKSAIPQ